MIVWFTMFTLVRDDHCFNIADSIIFYLFEDVIVVGDIGGNLHSVTQFDLSVAVQIFEIKHLRNDVSHSIVN